MNTPNMHALTEMNRKTGVDYYRGMHQDEFECPACAAKVRRFVNLIGNKNTLFCDGDHQIKGRKPKFTEAALRTYYGI